VSEVEALSKARHGSTRLTMTNGDDLVTLSEANAVSEVEALSKGASWFDKAHHDKRG
jgi:hypothetical protein